MTMTREEAARRGPRPGVAAARTARKDMPADERRLWALLRERRVGWPRFRRKPPLAGGIVDFACLSAKLAIRIERPGDGSRRGTASALPSEAALEAIGFVVLTFAAVEIERDLDGVVRAIRRRVAPAAERDAGHS